MALIEQGVELASQRRARVVLVEAHLLEHHFPLARELRRVEDGVEDHVGDQADAGNGAARWQQQVIEGIIIGGARVGAAPHRFHLGLDEATGPRGGALEEHVLREVREATLTDRLVATAYASPEVDGDGAGRAVLLHDQAEAAGQHFSRGCGQSVSWRGCEWGLRGAGGGHEQDHEREDARAPARGGGHGAPRYQSVPGASRESDPRQIVGRRLGGMPGRTPMSPRGDGGLFGRNTLSIL